MIKKIITAAVICAAIGLWYFGMDLQNYFEEALAPPK